jgi:hypothetical protein
MLVAAWVDIREAMMVMSATHHAVLIALAGGGATAHTNGDLVLQCQREASPKFAQGALRHATGGGACTKMATTTMTTMTTTTMTTTTTTTTTTNAQY